MASGKRKRSEGRQPDQILVAAVAVLLLIGLLMVFSTTITWSLEETGDPLYRVKRQALLMAAGIGLAVVLALIDLEWVRRAAVPLMAITVVALVLVLFFGSFAILQARSSAKWDGLL